jgi:chromate reductase, NAD(P)H dehydrogenase (quinone)
MMAGERIRVLGIAGSLRTGSLNMSLLKAARELQPDGMDITIYEGLGTIPPYNQDLDTDETRPAQVTALKKQIADADALLIVTPEYNYNVPGVLKNAIDWASRPPAETPLKNKPCAIMGASTGLGGTIRAQLAFRQSFLFTQTYAVLQPEVLVQKAAEKFDAQGRLTDETSIKLVRALLGKLIDWTRTINAGPEPR